MHEKNTFILLVVSAEDNMNICEQFKDQLCGDICIPVGKTFKCACKEGFMLDVDGKTCTIMPGNERFATIFKDGIIYKKKLLRIYLGYLEQKLRKLLAVIYNN